MRARLKRSSSCGGRRWSGRAVTLGIEDGDNVEVLSGVTPGDRVVVDPPAELAGGDRVVTD